MIIQVARGIYCDELPLLIMLEVAWRVDGSASLCRIGTSTERIHECSDVGSKHFDCYYRFAVLKRLDVMNSFGVQ